MCPVSWIVGTSRVPISICSEPPIQHLYHTNILTASIHLVNGVEPAVLFSCLPLFFDSRQGNLQWPLLWDESNDGWPNYPGPYLQQPWSGDGESHLKLVFDPQGTVGCRWKRGLMKGSSSTSHFNTGIHEIDPRFGKGIDGDIRDNTVCRTKHMLTIQD